VNRELCWFFAEIDSWPKEIPKGTIPSYGKQSRHRRQRELSSGQKYRRALLTTRRIRRQQFAAISVTDVVGQKGMATIGQNVNASYD